MGAQTFWDTAAGADCREAFANARNEAYEQMKFDWEYEYDEPFEYDGYSGTIYEKDDFVMLPFAENLRVALTEMSARIDTFDKWGPAGCIPFGDKNCPEHGTVAYLFFGWASS